METSIVVTIVVLILVFMIYVVIGIYIENKKYNNSFEGQQKIVDDAKELIHFLQIGKEDKCDKEQLMIDIIQIKEQINANESAFRLGYIKQKDYCKNIDAIDESITKVEKKYGFR